MNALPLARKYSLVVKELDGETLVYDRETDEAHCLSQTAATVWKNCDGHTSVTDIAQRLGAEAGTNVDNELVWLALEQLEQFKLLDQPLQVPPSFAGMSRRNMVRTLGLAAVALPMITSIIAPTAAMAGSLPLGACCEKKSECLDGFECSADEHHPECQKTCQEHG